MTQPAFPTIQTTTPKPAAAAPAAPVAQAEEEVEYSSTLDELEALSQETGTHRDRLKKGISKRLEALDLSGDTAGAVKYVLEELRDTLMPLLDDLNRHNLGQHQFVGAGIDALEEQIEDDGGDDSDPTLMRLSVPEVELLLELLMVLQSMAQSVLEPTLAAARREAMETELKQRKMPAADIAQNMAQYDDGQRKLAEATQKAAGMGARLQQWLQTQ